MGDQMDQNKRAVSRPLSPHLQIYKPMLTMTMSIVHRLTGVGLYFGALLFIWWLMAAASGPEQFQWISDIYSSLLGQIILLAALWGFFHHMLGGIRHFIWDFGKGFELNQVEFMARSGVVGSIVLTAIVWALL